jgi:hypothetical protein
MVSLGVAGVVIGAGQVCEPATGSGRIGVGRVATG